MPTGKPNRPTEATYTASQLPEVLRSKLIAGIVTRVLVDAARDGFGGDQSDPDPMAAVLTTTAEEIRAWHTQAPRPAELNGGS